MKWAGLQISFIGLLIKAEQLLNARARVCVCVCGVCVCVCVCVCEREEREREKRESVRARVQVLEAEMYLSLWFIIRPIIIIIIVDYSYTVYKERCNFADPEPLKRLTSIACQQEYQLKRGHTRDDRQWNKARVNLFQWLSMNRPSLIFDKRDDFYRPVNDRRNTMHKDAIENPIVHPLNWFLTAQYPPPSVVVRTVLAFGLSTYTDHTHVSIWGMPSNWTFSGSVTGWGTLGKLGSLSWFMNSIQIREIRAAVRPLFSEIC